MLQGVASPWALKFVFGFLSDRFPLVGFKRRSYAMLGWALSAAATGFIAIAFEEPLPYYCVQLQGNQHYDTGSVCNPHASANVMQIVIPLTLATLGGVTSTAAADGLMVECAQHGATAQARANYPVACLMARTVGMISASCFLAVCLGSPIYLGNAAWDIGINNAMFVCCGVSLASVLFWALLAQADRPQPHHVNCCSVAPALNGAYAHSYCNEAHRRLADTMELFSAEGFFAFVSYNLFAPAMVAFVPPTDGPMRRYWAQVGQAQHQGAKAATAVFFLITLALFQRCVAGTSWRALVCWATVAAVVIDTTIQIVVATDTSRNQYLYVLQDPASALPPAALYLVATLGCVEMAPQGQEATVFSLVTSAHSVVTPLAGAMANAFYSQLPFWISGNRLHVGALTLSKNYTEDTVWFQGIVCISVSTAALVTLSSLGLLPLLPRNEQNAGKLRVTPRTPRHAALGVILCAMLGICFVAGVTLGIMAIVPAMSCMQFLGGRGCTQT